MKIRYMPIWEGAYIQLIRTKDRRTIDFHKDIGLQTDEILAYIPFKFLPRARGEKVKLGFLNDYAFFRITMTYRGFTAIRNGYMCFSIVPVEESELEPALLEEAKKEIAKIADQYEKETQPLPIP